LFVVVYRTGNVTQASYDQVSDLLERLATFSSSMIVVGHFNIHVDDPTDADANKFADILYCNGLQQHVTSPTHCLGHTLDLFITRPELSVHTLPVDPLPLSDHSFLVADVVCPQQPVIDMPSFSRLTRYWRSLDVEAFAADLMCSDLAINPSDDVTRPLNAMMQRCGRYMISTCLFNPHASGPVRQHSGTTVSAGA
jgi:hypothetical protein